MRPAAPTPEHLRLADTAAGWKRWGPYLSERAWGTVREDYSEDGDAWRSFPHDHARSRAYRWNEDGLAGICDDRQLLCFAFAFWNGRDPILKERIFGLTGHEGNHGEDAKEHWWFLDSTPTHSYMAWRYVYPQAAFPYELLGSENRTRDRFQPEFEIEDTGVLEHGFWDVTVEYAKAAPHDICIRVRVINRGPRSETLHVLPSLWFRNTWSWRTGPVRPTIRAGEGGIVAEHPDLGRMILTGGGDPTLLFCENDTNTGRLYGDPDPPPFPKDGINDHVVQGASTVNPRREGTKAAQWHRLTVPAGEKALLHLRLAAGSGTGEPEEVLTARRSEADQYYRAITPIEATDEEARVVRQALAGLLWCKQWYHFDVERWLDGDPGRPPPPPPRLSGRNSAWRHLNNADIITMPDTWEYPWYAAWDVAFQCVPLAHVDPEFAKSQLVLLLREWYMHPNGQLPAYEWGFDDVNPPVHAWAALRVFEIDGSRDFEFLERVMQKLLINFTWWVNRKDSEGNNVFEGGFLGLDNIGPFDRSEALPAGLRLEQADGTAWMAMYCLDLLEMALILAEHDRTYEDLATKFFEHFAYVATAIHTQGLWDEKDGFYHDVIHSPDGSVAPLNVRSMVGLIPLFAVTVLEGQTLDRLPDFAERFRWFLRNKPQYRDVVAHLDLESSQHRRLLSIVSPTRLERILAVMLEPDEFLSPFGVRSLSRRHATEPFVFRWGDLTSVVDYQPGESTTPLFGGNSNWRGPVWFPLNHLAIEALHRFARFFGDGLEVECPTGSDRFVGLAQVASDLAERLVSLFLPGPDGVRPAHGPDWPFAGVPGFDDVVVFHEYFHGDTGRGLGASHQTGWTALVADLILGRSR